ncbi:hypothetical protein ABPG73_013016 [Tetrahymena malaccensis]
MKSYKDLYKQQEQKMRIAGQGSYYNNSSDQNQPLQQLQQQNVQQQASYGSQNMVSTAVKQQQGSQQIMSSAKPVTKTPLSTLIYQTAQSGSNNFNQQKLQQNQIQNSYNVQQQQMQHNSNIISQYPQHLYSHSQNVSANHSRDNSINKPRMPERKMSINAQPAQQIQQIQQQQAGSGSFYHHNHSHSHQIGATNISNNHKASPSFVSTSSNSFNNGSGPSSQTTSNNQIPSAGASVPAGSSSSTSSSSIQNPSGSQFSYKPSHKSSAVDSTIIQKLMKKQQVQQSQQISQQQQQQQYPFSQPQSFINSPKKSPKNSVSPNTRHPSFSQQTSQQQQQLGGGYGQQSNMNSQLNSKNTYQQMYHQLSNNYSQQISQKSSQQQSISKIPQQQQQYHHNTPQQSSSVLNVSQNNISSNNILISQNINNQAQSNNLNDNSGSLNGQQSTEKKPISFLNYLLLKEIAQRNTQDQVSNNVQNSNNISGIDIMASKMNTPNNASKVLINNFNEIPNSQSISKSNNNLYGGINGSSYSAFNQGTSQVNSQSQQKQPQQDLDHSYLSKYSQLLQSQQQSKQVSQPPSPYTYNHSHKSSIASTSNTNNMQGLTSMNSYSVSPQLPQSYSQQIPSTPTSTHRSQSQFQQQQNSKQAQDYQQSSKSSKSNSNNVSGLFSNTLVCSSNNIPQTEDLRIIPSCTSKNAFNFHYVIGKGGFGKVWKVEHRKTRQLFAMKEMSKSLIITKKSVNSVMNERNLLSQLKHPFLVNMFYAFQDRENLHLVMDLMPGGDLRYHIGRQRRFSEEQTRFFVACIFMGLEYLHDNNIIHRDIKPENLVLDSSGYVRITDLGIARTWKPDNASDTSGTPGYMAPEVMCRQPHTFAVDYFALGVLAYEFMLGRRPYLGRSRKEIRDQILAKRVQIKKHEIPDGWSLEAADFINRLIERKPANRLGINGPAEVKNHPWIKNFPWQKLIKKQIDAPFLPANEDNFDQKQQISLEDEQNQEIILQNAMLLKRQSVQNLFNGYNFDGGALQQQQQAQQIQQPQPTNQLSYQPQQYSQQQYQQSQSVSANGSIYSVNQQIPQHIPSSNSISNNGYQNPFSQRNSFSNVSNINQNMSHISQYSNMKESNYNDNSMMSVAKNNNNSAINSSRVYHQNNNNSRAVEKENFVPSRYSYDEVY